MVASVNQFLEWKQTRVGLLISGLVEAVLAYIFVSLALNSGSGWHYLLAGIFLIGAVISLLHAISRKSKG